MLEVQTCHRQCGRYLTAGLVQPWLQLLKQAPGAGSMWGPGQRAREPGSTRSYGRSVSVDSRLHGQIALITAGGIFRLDKRRVGVRAGATPLTLATVAYTARRAGVSGSPPRALETLRPAVSTILFCRRWASVSSAKYGFGTICVAELDREIEELQQVR